MDLPPIDHLAWIADHQDADAVHLDWSSVVWHDRPVEPPSIDADAPGGLGGDRKLHAQLAMHYDVDRDQVLLTLGATEAVVLATIAAAQGGTVAVETPTYAPLRVIPDVLGLDVVRFPRPSDDRFALHPDPAVERLEAGADLAVATNLHNPTGVGIDADRLRSLVEAARDRGAHVLVDEVYRRSAFGRTAPPACRLGGITVDSLTKFFGFGNLRLGWLVGPPEIVERARKVKTALNPSVVPQAIEVARWALDHEAELTRHARDRVETNRALVETWVDQHDVAWVPPSHGTVCAPRLPDRWADDVAFARRAADRGVVVVPGSFFELPGHVRLGFGVARNRLETGLKTLSDVLREDP